MAEDRILEHLVAIRGDLRELQSNLGEIKRSVGAIENGLVDLAATGACHFTGLSTRFDRVDRSLDRIEGHLRLAAL